MENYITHGSLNIHNDLDRFLKEEVLTELDITRDEFWEKFEEILRKFHHRNKDLLMKRSFYILQEKEIPLQIYTIGRGLSINGVYLERRLLTFWL